jgi:subtilisin family serine protease
MKRLLYACLLVAAAILMWWLGAPGPKEGEPASLPASEKIDAAPTAASDPRSESGGPKEDETSPAKQDRYAGLPVVEVRESLRTVGAVKRIKRLRLVRNEDFKYPLIRVKEEWVEDEKGRRMITQLGMVADHILMKPADPKLDEGEVLARLARLGGTMRKKMPSSGIWLVSFPEPDLDTIPEALEEAAKHQDLILYAEPDYLAFAEVVPDDASFDSLWGMNNTGQSGGTVDADIDAVEAWDIHTGSHTVRVGVIDTGIDYTHPELSANIWANPAEAAGTPGFDDDGNGYIDDIRGWDFANNDNNPIDDHNHGTHVSGTIGAVGNNAAGVAGVCWQVSLVPLKFLDASGSGATSDAVEATAYATDLGIDLTSNSWGGGGFSQALQDVIDEANAAGKLFVCAAGNESSNNDVVDSYPSNHNSPNLIAVASSTRTDTLSSFSNYGVTQVDLAAPGSEILSTTIGGTFATFNGTSMATPHVSGACALIKAYKPDLTHLEVRDIILQTVDYVPELATASATGGRLNVVQALQASGDLTVTPATPFVVEGPKGGAFHPASSTYTLKNRGAEALSWTGSSDQAWLGVTPLAGNLGPGESVVVTASIESPADDLAPGDYSATVMIENVASGLAISRQVALTVTPPVVASFTLETDPGWPKTGEWQFGEPLGQGGLSYGFADPTSGYTGANVLGVNLAGDYSIAVGGPFTLTAGPFDLSKRHTTSLRYRRWLNTDYQPWVSANVEVSTNGTTWTTVWTNGGSSVTDNAWRTIEHDLSTVADREEEVWVRWSYEIGTTGAFPLSGWNLDDVVVFGLPTALLEFVDGGEVTEGGSDLQLTLTVDPAPLEDLTVDLLGSDLVQLTVPTSVVVPAGETSVPVTVSAVDDALLDGTQRITVTASSADYIGGETTVAVHDDETTTLTLTLPPQLTEGAGVVPGQAMVTLATAAEADVTVSLASDDVGELAVPSFVVVPSGMTSASFDLTVPDDIEIDGLQTATVTASVLGWTSGVSSVDILDNESLNLVVHVPASMIEGQAASTGEVRLSGTLAAPLDVTLVNAAPDQVAVPGTVSIAAGSLSGMFTVAPVDDGLVDGVASVEITASATGFVDGAGTVLVYDNETPALAAQPSPADADNRAHPQSDLAWSYDLTTGAAPDSADVYLGTGSTLEPGDLLATVTSPVLALDALTPGATYRWQVVSKLGAVETVGPVWTFTVPPVGEVVRYEWSVLSSQQLVDAPIPVTITAYDEFDNVVTPWNGDVSIGPVLSPTSMVISEINPNTPDAVELTNVSSQPVDVSNWTLYLYDVDSNPGPLTPFVFPEGTTCEPGATFTITEFGTAPGTAPDFFLGFNINWTASAASSVAVLLTRPDGTIADFMCGGLLESSAIADPLLIPVEQWSGPPANAPTFESLVYGRQGNQDSHSPSDWAAVVGSMGLLNDSLTVPFADTLASVEVDPTEVTFVEGVWTGDVRVREAAVEMRLGAEDAEGRTGESNQFEVISSGDLTLTFGQAGASEGDGVVADVAIVGLSVAVGIDIPVTLTPDDVTEMAVTTVVVLAGQTSATGPVEVLDDALLDGSRQVRVEATASAFHRAEADFWIHDDESADLTLTLPSVVTEGQGVLVEQGTVEASQPVDEHVVVTLESLDASEITVPATVTLLAGETGAVFDLNPIDDSLLDGDVTAEVTASVVGWTAGSGTVEVRDNEVPTLALAAPATVVEGDGMITATVSLTGEAVEDITVALSSSAVTEIGVPASVTIPTGSSSATFDLNVADDPDMDGSFSVTITATSAGLSEAHATISVLDNDAASMVFDAVAGPQKEGVPFAVTLTALDAEGDPMTAVGGPVVLSASGDTGPVGVEPGELTGFVNGVWSGDVRVLGADTGVMLTATTPTAAGSSNAFNINPGPRLNVSPVSVDASVAAGFSTRVDVTLTNVGAEPLTWTGAENADWLSVSSSGGTLQPSDAVVLALTFDAAALSEGELTSDWTLTSNDGLRPSVVIPVSLTVLPGLDHFTWDPVADPQLIGAEIPVQVSARDANGTLIPQFDGTVDLSASGTGGVSNVDIGSGTFNAAHVLRSGYTEGRTQMIYMADEVGGAGNIVKMGLDFAAVSSVPFTNVIIRMRPTGLVDFAGTDIAWKTVGWSTVFEGEIAPSGSGWHDILLDTPFEHDGVSNLMIDISYLLAATGTPASCRAFDDGTNVRVLHYYRTTGGPHPSTWEDVDPYPYQYTFRPNLRLEVADGALPITPEVTGAFVDGVWSGQVQVGSLASDVTLRAWDPISGREGTSNLFDIVALTDLSVTLPSEAAEGDGVLSAAGRVDLSASLESDLTVSLVSLDSSEIAVPAEVVVPAGSTGADFDVNVVDDALLDGPIEVRVEASAIGAQAAASTPMVIADNEVTTLTVTGLTPVVEAGSAVQVTLELGMPVSESLTATVASADPSLLQVAGTVDFAANTSTATVALSAPDNAYVDGTQTVELSAALGALISGTAQVQIEDDESQAIVIAVTPGAFGEADGTVAAAGEVTLGGLVRQDRAITIVSDDPSEVGGTSAVVAADGSTASFDVTVKDDSETDGAQSVTLTASASGLVSGQTSFLVRDDDAHNFVFSTIVGPKFRDVTFPVTVLARTVDGQAATSFDQVVSLYATLPDETLIPTTPAATTAFVDGAWSGEVSVGASGIGVALAAEDGDFHSGTSNAFDVVSDDEPPFISLTTPSGGFTLAEHFTIRGTSNDSGSGVSSVTVSGVGVEALGSLGEGSNPFDSWTFTTPSLEDGANSFLVVATDGAQPANSSSVSWSIHRVMDPEGDEDANGVPELLEEAFALDEDDPHGGLPTSGTAENPSDGKAYLIVNYRRRIEPGGFRYIVETSANMTDWSSIEGDVEVLGATANGDGVTETCVLRIHPAIGDVDGKFVRVRVELD